MEVKHLSITPVGATYLAKELKKRGMLAGMPGTKGLPESLVSSLRSGLNYILSGGRRSGEPFDGGYLRAIAGRPILALCEPVVESIVQVTGFTEAELFGRGPGDRKRVLCEARQMVYAAMAEVLQLRPVAISDRISKREHTAVGYALQIHGDAMATDASYRSLYFSRRAQVQQIAREHMEGVVREMLPEEMLLELSEGVGAEAVLGVAVGVVKPKSLLEMREWLNAMPQHLLNDQPRLVLMERGGRQSKEVKKMLLHRQPGGKIVFELHT